MMNRKKKLLLKVVEKYSYYIIKSMIMEEFI